MKPAPFAYHAPSSIAETVGLLDELAAEDGRVLAGGQSLVPTMAFRLARPGHLIDINRVAELDRLELESDALRIGAAVRHAAFHRPVEPGPLGRLLSSVVPHIAHYPIRLRGTFCGSLAHADPAAEWCLVAATLGAEIFARSISGIRRLKAAEFFLGIMTTGLAENELLTEAQLPLLEPDTRFGFYEFARRAGDYALAMALVTLRIIDGVIIEPRIGIGGAEASPRRIREAEAALSGCPPEAASFCAAAEAAADVVDPLDDAHSDADYRRDLVRVVTRRALKRTLA